MRLELRSNGSVAMREVTADAMDYINRERQKLTDPIYQHWSFSLNYEGTVYITATPYEDKTELVGMIDELIAHYGLTVPDNVKPLLYSWRRDVLYAGQAYEANARINALEGRLRSLQRVMKEGCEACADFRYDGECGRCKADGKELGETPLSFRCGKYDGRGVKCLGSKFYPHEGCKFLQEVKA